MTSPESFDPALRPSARGLQRLINACGYSLSGLAAAWRHEEAFRQEVMLAVVLCPLSFWLARDALDVVLLNGAALLVLITELCNSAIEALTDRVGFEHHELSKRAKDLGSAAVFLALVVLVMVWAAVAWLHFAV